MSPADLVFVHVETGKERLTLFQNPLTQSWWNAIVENALVCCCVEIYLGWHGGGILRRFSIATPPLPLRAERPSHTCD